MPNRENPAARSIEIGASAAARTLAACRRCQNSHGCRAMTHARKKERPARELFSRFSRRVIASRDSDLRMRVETCDSAVRERLKNRRDPRNRSDCMNA
jgi:hypothetical protein